MSCGRLCARDAGCRIIRNSVPLANRPWFGAEIESRNADGARRRGLRSRASPTGEVVGPITLKGGTIIQLPSGDEHAPGHPLRVLALHPSLGSFESSSDSDEASWPGALFLGGQTPIRSSGDLNAPSPQRPRTDSTTAQSAVDEEYLARHESPARDTPGSVVVTDGELRSALRLPLEAGSLSFRRSPPFCCGL